MCFWRYGNISALIYPGSARVLAAARDEPFQVTRQQVHLEVYAAARAQTLEIRSGKRVRDQIDLELAALDGVHREAHAVHGHGALGRDVARQLRRRTHQDRSVVAHGLDPRHFTDAVDVSGHEVPSKTVGQAQRLLQVDFGR